MHMNKLIGSIGQIRHRAYLAACGIALIFAVPVGSYLIYLEHQQQAEVLAQARFHANFHARMLGQAMERLSRAPLLLTASLGLQSETAFISLAREVMRQNDAVESIEIARSGQRPLSINHEGKITNRPEEQSSPAPHEALLPALGSVPLTSAGDPIISTRGALLVSTQALSSKQKFWGYATAIAPLSALIDEARLPDLVADGYAVQLHYFRENRAPLLTIFEKQTVAAKADWAVSAIPVSGGGYLQLRVQAATPGSAALSDLRWAFMLLGTLLAFFLSLRLLRRPAELESEVRLRTRQLDEEKIALQKEINSRESTERSLERSHTLLDTMFENLPGMITLKRASNLRILRVNQTTERLLGRKRDTLVGHSNEEIYPAEFAGMLSDTDYRAMLESGVIELPAERLTLRGQPERWLRVRKIALRDSKGRPEYILEFAEDITGQEALARRLTELLNFSEQFVNAIPSPVFLKDGEGRYIEVNAAFESLFGVKRAELIGRRSIDGSPEDIDSHRRFDPELLVEGGSRIYEANSRDASGTRHDLLFHKALTRATNGEAGGIVGVVHDISERKASEVRARRLNRVLSTLSAVNQTIIRTRNSSALVQEIAELIHLEGAFPSVWVRFEPTNQLIIRTHGDATTGITEKLITALSQPDSPCSLNQSIFCSPAQRCDNKLCAQMAETGLGYIVHLPLNIGSSMVGGIGILGGAADVLAEEEHQLLKELAENTALALDSIAREEQRKGAESKLHLAARVFENSAEGIMITDANNRILMVNKVFSAVTGYTPEEVVGMNPNLLSSGRQSAAFYQQLWHSLQTSGEWRGEVENRRKNGEHYPEWLNISVVRNECGDIVNFVAVFSDLTSHKQVAERLNFLAHFDALTSLPNRLLFSERLEQGLDIATRTKSALAVIFLDIDRFKLINETVGHATGDLLLLEISQRLTSCINDGDTVARLGGDEFALILNGVNHANDAATRAVSIQKALHQPIELAGHEFRLSASIGISVYPDDASTAEELTGNADSAMYSAVAEGGNTYRFFHHEMNQNSAERMLLEGKLHGALERKELIVYFQPLVAADNGRILGAEALLRWDQPDLGGFISPATFIPVLEETGLIIEVGEWVLRTACQEAQLWRQTTGGEYFVAVNLSAIQLTDPLLLDKVKKILQLSGLPANCLEIELTESAIMRDKKRGIEVLESLHELGIKLSIDDFGTGHSSLSYLKQLPIDTLKIDQSFVADLPEDREAVSITRAIIALGHSLQLEIIAEGVEKAGQVIFLRETGADILQGFHFSRAIPATDFRQLLAAGAYPLPAAATDNKHARRGDCTVIPIKARI
jgi:diguanylate cyclase (GGDEF)-like protein/PAS domain S-box-containing protein